MPIHHMIIHCNTNLPISYLSPMKTKDLFPTEFYKILKKKPFFHLFNYFYSDKIELKS